MVGKIIELAILCDMTVFAAPKTMPDEDEMMDLADLHFIANYRNFIHICNEKTLCNLEMNLEHFYNISCNNQHYLGASKMDFILLFLKKIADKHNALRFPLAMVAIVHIFIRNLAREVYKSYKKGGIVSKAILCILIVSLVGGSIVVPTVAWDEDKYNLICDVEEHEHTEECYESNLVCELEEDEDHTHSDECYEQLLVCEKEEHQHGADCYEEKTIVEQVTEENDKFEDILDAYSALISKYFDGVSATDIRATVLAMDSTENLHEDYSEIYENLINLDDDDYSEFLELYSDIEDKLGLIGQALQETIGDGETPILYDIMYDTQAPVIKDMSLDKTVVTVPEEITLSLEIEDLSGVRTTSVDVCFESETGRNINFVWYETTYEKEGSVYKYTYDIINPENADDSYIPYKGQYKISYIEVTDNVGNRYYCDNNDMPSQFIGLEFAVINNGSSVIDTQAPIIKSMTLDKTKVVVPEEITLALEIEDLSGVRTTSVAVCFESEVGRNIDFVWYETTYEMKDNIYKYTYNVENPQYTNEEYRPYKGQYKISRIEITDNVGNRYYCDNNDIPSRFKNLEFTVINNGSSVIDTQEPVIETMSLDKMIVTVPEEITLTLDIADMSGVRTTSVAVCFESEVGRNIDFVWHETNYEKEGSIYKYTYSVENPQYANEGYKPYKGQYKISSIDVTDNVGNRYYCGKDDVPTIFKNLQFFVYNDVDGLDSTTTNDSNFISYINEQSDDAIIGVDYSYNGNIGKDFFDTIVDTSKTVYFIGTDVQWKFKGSDITGDNNKLINLNVNVQQKENLSGTVKDDIQNLVDDRSSVVLKFAENGVLPGKATIRLKADSVMKDYLGQSGLDVYYFDQTENKLVPIASNISITEDSFIEFEIEHCSYYVVTGRKIIYDDEYYSELFKNLDYSINEAGVNYLGSDMTAFRSIFSDEELRFALQNNKSLGISFVAADCEPSQRKKDMIADELNNGYKVYSYFDFSINAKISGENQRNITVTSSPLRFEKAIDGDFYGSEDRKYQILRLHDDNVSVVGDGTSRWIDFSTDKTGLYAIAYKDVVDEENLSEKDEEYHFSLERKSKKNQKTKKEKKQSTNKEPIATPTATQMQHDLINQSLEVQIANITAVTGTNATPSVIKLDGGMIINSLSKSTLQRIVDLKTISCEFTYIYNGEKRVTIIPADVVLDPLVEWYGPLYMQAKYPTYKVTPNGLVGINVITTLVNNITL